ncbi:DUF349 domain-containing protein [Pontibacter chinhatensis]|uniref:DUF349 domain-containing protein n=1 Tax=Pontibacter chinhatensis TaxID=1436961 RepID=A0A1I2M7E3_9BACT|nr:DUF349 domain-containing protein [Pontibacter chinhatensis]SFF87392.1 protein of unknown function [Pontibacter chinhatensis]
MTTDKEHMDTTGAEANKPENKATADDQNQVTPKQEPATEETTAEAGPEVPKEEQPEVKPELATDEEEASTEQITETFAEANTNVTEPAAQPTDTTDAATATPDHHDEEEYEEDDHTDYSQLTQEELRQRLFAALKSPDALRKYKTISELQSQYELKFQAERHDALDKFKEEGGTEEDFDYHTSKEHQDLEKMLAAYRESRYQHRQTQEEQRQRNLERKKELLGRLRELVESAETRNSGDELKKLQSEWKSIGPVPAGEAQELWDSYHALLDIFYNNRSMFFELKELDRRRNLEAKLQLIERAQALQQEPSINKALQELRHLHEEWKIIGPVPNDQRDQIWEQFTLASEKVHERRRAYHEERSVREQQSLVVKRGLLERLQEFANFNTDRINEWRDKTDEIQKLKEEWDKAGLVPKENAEEVNKAFWGNYKAFFQHKNQFFKALDEQKMHNLQLKTQLCEEAESLKDSTDWASTKEKLIQLQKKWKTIGRVPDKYSDKIWQRFRSACNEFFDRKQAQEQHKAAELEKLSAEKMAICDKVADKLSQPSATGSVEEFQSLVEQWRETDKDNRRTSPKAEDKFIQLMERYLERVPELSLDERTDMLVKLQVERIKHSPDASQKLYQRENTLRREISQLQNDIQTLRTNIEFFARSKNADKLREEYEGRIADAQKRIAHLQHQLDAYRG